MADHSFTLDSWGLVRQFCRSQKLTLKAAKLKKQGKLQYWNREVKVFNKTSCH